MEYRKIGEITKITSGGTPSRKIKKYYEKGKIKWIKTGDLKVKYIYEAKELITDEAVKNSSAKLFPAKTVLIAMYGATIGACSILGTEATTNQACAALLPSKNYVSEYMYYCIKFKKEDIISKGVGGAQPNISAKILNNYEVPLPPLQTQKKIVEILDKAQEIIDGRKEQIKMIDDLIQATFYEMFGDPVTNPKEWKKAKFNDVAPVNQQKINLEQKKVWLLNLDAIEADSGNISHYNYVVKEEIGSSTMMFDETNILYSKLRPYLNKVVKPKMRGYGTSELVPLKPNKYYLNRDYLLYYLRTKEFVSYISNKVSGAKMPRVVMKDFKNHELILPPIHLQNQFAEKVEAIEKQKELMKKSLKKMENNYNALMQKAFKGELFQE